MKNNKNLQTNSNKINSREKQNIMLRTFSSLENTEVLNKLNSSKHGLDKEQIIKNRIQFGDNSLTQKKGQSIFKRIIESFINPFTTILIVLALVSGITDIIIPMKQNSFEDINPITVIIIISMVIISGVLKLVQESRSDKAASSLLAMISTTTCIERVDTGIQEIPLNDVVVGDIVHLAAGDMIPADIKIIEAKDLFISQSSLTGESEPVEKKVFATNNESLTEIENLAFLGTNVISGFATGVVLATGDKTIFGDIAKAISSASTTTSFEKGVNSVSWLLIRFMLVMVPVVFFINGITKGDWKDAFLFSISIAVGLTPEMLPMIVTTSLAKGAMSMSKKKTIVKNLNSIQNFGAIDILCTDKTGTLTQDKVILEYHLDVHGNEDERVLRHAFLNSYFQTGLKNLIDVAIIESAKKELNSNDTYNIISSRYHKVDEIPFDFNRRRMSVVVEDENNKTQMITKGAIEEMLSICSHVEYKGSVIALDNMLKKEILEIIDNLNSDGMRVIAVAQKTNPSNVDIFSVEDEIDMVLIGYLAFLDPPKETTKAAIDALKEYGVATKILTGDNEKVTKSICKQVGLEVENILLGNDIEKMDDRELSQLLEVTNVFAKLSPDQKVRIVRILRENGHVVGFMGDGINDAAAMKSADIGISVDTAVDIAKESADIILLEKDLLVLEEGIIEGRKTYANMIKYIKMTASSNFGNMFSVLISSAFIPFLPMMSIHLILLNLIYDLSCTAIPWDNVDVEYLKKPRKWDASSIGKFMLWIGPTSSVFDLTTFLLMYFIICPKFISEGVLFNSIPEADITLKTMYIALFQAGWFVESMWSQTLVIHMIRTAKIPFIQSRASLPVVALTLLGIVLLTSIPFTKLGEIIGLAPLPLEYFAWLAVTIIAYITLVTLIKNIYIKKYNELL